MLNIEDKIKQLSKKYDFIVFKGIKIKGKEVDFEEILKDKMKYYFDNIYTKKIKILYYEEYLSLKNIIESSHMKIVILENNIYINKFPVYSILSEKMKKAIKENVIFEATGEENTSESSRLLESDDYIDDCLDVFFEVENILGRDYVIYRDITDEMENNYVQKLYITDSKIEFKIKESGNKIINILSENDFIELVESIEKGHNNFIIDQNWEEDFVKEKLEIFSKYFNIEIFLKKNKKEKQKYHFKKDIYNILKKYWGYDEFRTLKTYDEDEIEFQNKIIKEVSQENIISDIINESEKIYKNSGRDIFITAPTGSGKSIMFQIPAIYLSENYDKVTIVITPLIGLMKDQVSNLKSKGYFKARTINSEVSLMEKENILEDIRQGKCKILYISPETLIGSSILDSIFKNDQDIGLIVIDEAHIVTTWGKQFRPDYWYLGDHIKKIRSKYIKASKESFIISTFTATATYAGRENMFQETKSSLYLNNPIKYFGVVKREDISFDIGLLETKTNRIEYKKDKFNSIINTIKKNLLYGKKTLIYFPTIALIRDFMGELAIKNLKKYSVEYYGTLDKNEKTENEYLFRNGERLIMAATKAFGMGVDINDINQVIHFAPTGNLCDYIQEVGRIARKEGMTGVAKYNFMSNDFKYINRFHGMSTIKNYQIIAVLKKIEKLYEEMRLKPLVGESRRKRNEMLIDTADFSHIFRSNLTSDDGEVLNKVKTTLLVIQKGFQEYKSYPPFAMRLLPLFAKGYFKVENDKKKEVLQKFGHFMREERGDIYEVNLKQIWEKYYGNNFSFPQFKFFLYSSNEEKIKDTILMNLKGSIKINIFLKKERAERLRNLKKHLQILEDITAKSSMGVTYLSVENLADKIEEKFKNRGFKAKEIAEIFISSVLNYEKDFKKTLNGKLIKINYGKNSNKYLFLNNMDQYFKWIKTSYNYIEKNLEDEALYISNYTKQKEILAVLGFLEVLEILNFKSLGGSSGQLYLYINEIRSIKNITAKPWSYRNKILDKVHERHILGVELLTYIFKEAKKDEVWDIVEDYFLGKIPPIVEKNFLKKLTKEAR